MKKLFRVFIVLLCAVAAFVSFAACSGAPKHEVGGAEYAISRETLENTLADFVENNVDRTSFSDGEWQAALYIQEKLISYGYIDAEIDEFSVRESETAVYSSRNVQAVYNGGAQKNVIIGAYYDNSFGVKNSSSSLLTNPDGGSEIGTHGALSNGTGVATALAIAEYFQANNIELDYSVTFVFFGAGAKSVSGAKHYLGKMSEADKDNTVLMIELQRLGVDHVYAFTDARKNSREAFFDRVAEESRLNIYKISQKSPVMPNVYSIEGIPFYQWAHGGVFPVFANAEIPTLNLVGANWETMDITDRESASNADITLTKNDTLSDLKKLYPDYSVKLAEAATLVINSLTDSEFLSVMQHDSDNFPHTEILMQQWIWYIVVLGIIAITALIMMLVTSVLSKKYPPVVPKPKNVKFAVFGVDYEDKDPDSIYIDIKNVRGDSIFPGVPDNDPFPEYGAPSAPKPSAEQPAQKSGAVDPFELAVIKSELKADDDEKAKNQTADNTPNDEKEEKAEKPENTHEFSGKGEPAPEKPKKRPTVSAGKSVGAGAKKTTRKKSDVASKNGDSADSANKDGREEKGAE